MKHLILAVACVALLSVVACKANYDKTKSGLVYRIVSSKGGEPVKAGEFVKFNVEFRLSTPKDTVLNSTYGKFPGYSKIDTGAQVAYSFFEIMPKCKVGDSVEFSISVDTLEKRKMIPGYNTLFVRNGVIKGTLTILKTFSKEELVKTDYDAEADKMKSKEIASLQDYITKKGAKTTKTKSGVFVEIDQPGDTSVMAAPGKQVSIMYKGYLQDGGKVFDTNMDTTKHHTDPIDVVVGQGRVIPGWEEALPYFGKGAKGKIYIPSSMGYGMQGSGEIPPNANLVFDIEIKDVKDAPPQPQAGQGMNNMTPEQMQQLQQMMQQRQQGQKDSSAAPHK